MASEHPYASFVHLVQKPARYLGGEHGAKTKDWTSVKARVCLAFPDLYDIGMSHLGFKILYKILNDDPRTLGERCYAPWVDMRKELVERNVPLVSLESARPLREFDVVGFSLQFELTYTNVLMMMELGGIPLRTSDRAENDPLIIAGGPTATHPEPIAAFIDAFVIGDGEERITEVSLLWTSLREKNVPRAERLVEIAKLRGVYAPSLYATKVEAETGHLVVDGPISPEISLPMPIERSLLDDLDRFPFPSDGPVGGPEAIFDRMSIEIARGCTEGCRFCQAGMIYRPVRERDPEVVVETLARAVQESGYDEVSLTSLSTADYSCIAPLIKKVTDRLAPEKVSLGVSSLRAYGLEEPVLDDIQRVRASGVTFAPEAGSQRMRDVVNKNVTEEQLMTTAERVFSRNWNAMKLYFMIGLPTEEESDVREIAKVGGRAREVGRRIKKTRGEGAPTVTVSVSTHVPKPHTPFQWCAMDAHVDVVEKQRWLKEEARAAKVDLRMHDSETSWLEGVFARGDRSLCDVLERAYKDGAAFDSWEDQLKIEIWENAFKAHNVEPARFLGTIPVTARLPWSHIDVGLEEGFLVREYRKALKSRLSPPCGKAAGMFVHHTNISEANEDDRKLVCYDCGVACDLGAMREDRLVKLSRLGAKVRRVVEPVPPPKPREPGKKKGPPPLIVQGEPRRYRLAYTKLGRSAFLSHLDLIRALPRSFRRVGATMFYSSGYHPKPDMVFGPALSLGIASLEEQLDVKLTCDMDPMELARALSDSSPEGVRFTNATRLGSNDAALGRVIEAAEYVICVPRTALAPLGGGAWLRGEIARFVSSTEAIVLRKIEGVGKKVNVRDLVREVSLDDERARNAVNAAGILGDLVAMLIECEVRATGSAKISEVAQVIFGERGADLPYRAIRIGTRARDGEGRLVSPLDLASIRARRASSATSATSETSETKQDVASTELAG